MSTGAVRRAWYWRNRDKEIERLRPLRKAWELNNREKRREISKRAKKRYRAKHREKILAWRRGYEAKRKLEDVGYRIQKRLRLRLYECSVGKRTTSALVLLGCSIDEFKSYLESRFKSGMTWENWGRDGWHIDHIIPCSKFDLRKPEHQKRCFHFSNLQPMWAKDNRQKYDSVLDGQFNLL